jgi:predicted RNA-binding protein
MAYYLDLFSPETYEAFTKSERNISGFRTSHSNAADKIQPGDKFICYLTKLSRWVGILEVQSRSFIDDTPRFYEETDPFVVRFTVVPIAWLPKEKAIPIREDIIWNTLSFTKDHSKQGSQWTGKLRSSLAKIAPQDGEFLEKLIIKQSKNGLTYDINEDEYAKLLTQRIRGAKKTVSVSVPREETNIESGATDSQIRESIRIQASLAEIGEKMGFKIWLPKSDRSRVLQKWRPESDSLIESLPLNYDQATLKTIEQIDVLWLKRRSIVRAFEVEHTTSIYSGILRMADLLALQPNMDIKLHLVTPTDRKEKVFEEIQRPVFSLLEKGALSEFCTYISYESIYEIAELKHLNHLSDRVLEDYEEIVE